MTPSKKRKPFLAGIPNVPLQDLIDQGYELIEKKDPDKALQLFNQASTMDANNTQVVSGLGWSLVLTGDLHKAMNHFDTVLEKDQNNLLALRGKAYCLLNLGKYSDANKLYQRHIDSDSTLPQVWFNKGYVLIQMGEYEDAITCFQKFHESVADYPLDTQYTIDAFNYQGYATANINDLESADKLFDKALDIDKTSFGAKMGKQFVQQKRYFMEQQQELIETAKKYLKCLLKDFRSGLNIAQYMYVIQFSAGIGLLILSLILAVLGNNNLLALIVGASGGLTTVLSFMYTAPGDLQKNRVDFSQWMMAYFNWINALYTVSGTINQKTKDKKGIEWEEMAEYQDYLTNVTNETIKTVETYCEVPRKKQKIFGQKSQKSEQNSIGTIPPDNEAKAEQPQDAVTQSQPK